MTIHVSVDRRRAELLRRSAELRAELELCTDAVRERLQPVDEGTRWIRRHAGKLVLGGGVLLLLMRGPRRLLKLAGPLAVAWPIARRWLPALASLAMSRRARTGD
jgi:YqjK-like protein